MGAGGTLWVMQAGNQISPDGCGVQIPITFIWSENDTNKNTLVQQVTLNAITFLR